MSFLKGVFGGEAPPPQDLGVKISPNKPEAPELPPPPVPPYNLKEVTNLHHGKLEDNTFILKSDLFSFSQCFTRC